MTFLNNRNRILCFALAALMAAALGAAQNAAPPTQNAIPKLDLQDKAPDAGLNDVTVFGTDRKDYILETTGTGVAIFDYDNDGWPDIFLVNGTKLNADPKSAPPSRLYRNLHNGKFSDVTKEAGIDISGWGQGVCAGDFDNDGWTDLYVTAYGSNHLLQNVKGKFKDVSQQAGVAGTKRRWGTGCAFVDYDRDGKLDLVVANYVDFDLSSAPAPGSRPTCVWKGAGVMCGPRGLNGDTNILYHNVGGGKFQDVSKAAGITETAGHFCFSVSTLDYNDDGWPDVYIACDSTPSILYRNNKDGTFTDVAVVAGAAYNDDGREQAGMGSAIGDFDRDGRLDIFKTNFSDDTATLYRNVGDGSFSDVTVAAGLAINTDLLGWGAAFADIDNDSWSDLLVVNGHVYPEVDRGLGSRYFQPKLLYYNAGGKFIDVSRKSGAALLSASAARGLAVGDLWNDGRLSAVVSNMNARPNLLVNEARNANHWLGLKLQGTKSNRSAIGARVTLSFGGKLSVDEVRSGSSYISQNDLRLHFGLGAATSVDWLQVRWPSGLVEEFPVQKVDTILELVEGSGRVSKATK